MLIYLLVFLISTLLIYIANKINDSVGTRIRKKILYYVIVTIALLIPSILAGMRDFSIGTDVLVYGNAWFQNALQMVNFQIYSAWATSSSIGYLYAVINFVVSRFTNDPHVLYFYISLLENVFVYWAIRRQKDWLNTPYAMLVYFLLFYNYNLNILRQGLATVVILWGFKYVREQKLIKYILTVWVAYGFHNTAYFGIVIYLVYWIATNKISKNLKYLLIVGFVLGLAFFKKIVGLLLAHGILGDRYIGYIDGSVVRGGFFAQLLLSLPILVYALVVTLGKENSKLYGVFYLVILGSMMSVLNLNTAFLSRLTQYINFMYIIFWPILIQNSNIRFTGYNIEGSRKIVYVVVTFYLLIYWYIIYVYMKSGQTVPYIIDPMYRHLFQW